MEAVRAVTYAAAGCIATWLLAATLVPETAVPVFLGMAAPLVVSSAMLVLAERTYRRHAAALTPLMAQAFTAKMAFFAAYVSIVVGLLPVRTGPFVISFTAYFIALHMVGAAFFHALFRRSMTVPTVTTEAAR